MLNYSEIEEIVLPCDYTLAEAEQRIIQSTADADNNRDCMTNTEFRNQFFTFKEKLFNINNTCYF